VHVLSPIERAAAHAAQQHGVISLHQLLDCGLPQSTISDWEARGQLVRLAPQVYRFAGAPDTWRQRVAVATLDSGGWASHRTAAALHGLDGQRGRVIEVVVERWRRSSRQTPYRVHESKDLRGSDLTVVDGIPATTLVRTLVDLPAVEHFIRAEQAFDDACRKNRDVLSLTRRRFVEVARRGRNGTTAMRKILQERTGERIPRGSSFESKALRMIKNAELPKPVLQYMVEDGDFRAFLDISWPPVRFALECDSLAHHFGKRAHEHDRRRRRRLKALGWEVIEVTYEEVDQTPEAVAAELRQLLRLAYLRSGVNETGIAV
jgi:predicted transcriptional regulator of viral defense system